MREKKNKYKDLQKDKWVSILNKKVAGLVNGKMVNSLIKMVNKQLKQLVMEKCSPMKDCHI